MKHIVLLQPRPHSPLQHGGWAANQLGAALGKINMVESAGESLPQPTQQILHENVCSLTVVLREYSIVLNAEKMHQFPSR